jgi:hypothetical protein
VYRVNRPTLDRDQIAYTSFNRKLGRLLAPDVTHIQARDLERICDTHGQRYSLVRKENKYIIVKCNISIKTQIYVQNIKATFISKCCLVLSIYRSTHSPIYLPIYYYDYYYLSLYKCEVIIIICL